MASARWLSKVLGLIFIREAPCLLEHPSLIRLSTSRSRLVSGLRPDSDEIITPAPDHHPWRGQLDLPFPVCDRNQGLPEDDYPKSASAWRRRVRFVETRSLPPAAGKCDCPMLPKTVGCAA